MKDDKELMTNSILETADSASAYAEARLEEVRFEYQKRKIKLMKIGCMMIIVSVVLVFVTRSWFTMSRSVEGTDASMTSSSALFELKTLGSLTPNATLISDNNFGFLSGILVSSNENETRKTGGSYSSIQWLISSTDPMVSATGIKPKTSGHLQFIVSPTDAADSSKDLNIEYTLTMSAYKISDSKLAAIEAALKADETPPEVEYSDLELIASNDDASRFLQGHILFFENEVSGKYNDRIIPGQSKEVSFLANSDHTVDIYWVWPELLGQTIKSGFENSLFEESERQKMISHITNNPSCYFSIGNDVPQSNGKLDPVVLGNGLDTYYPILSTAYNYADQTIGTDVNYILFELTVSGNQSE